DGHRRDFVAPHIGRDLERDLLVHDGGLVDGGDLREVRPDGVVEEVVLQRGEGGAGGGDHQGGGADLGAIVCQRRQIADVIEVRVADQHHLDASLLAQVELTGDRARVDRDSVVEQKCRGAMPRRLAAMASENPKIHPPSLAAWGLHSGHWPVEDFTNPYNRDTSGTRMPSRLMRRSCSRMSCLEISPISVSDTATSSAMSPRRLRIQIPSPVRSSLISA